VSDWRKADIQATIVGDWWWLAAAFEAHVNYRDEGQPKISNASGHGIGSEYSYDYSIRNPDKPYAPAVSIGTIHFRGDDGQTHIAIVFASDYAAPVWRGILKFLRETAARAHMHRKEATGAVFEQILDEYYMAKKNGESPNLREMANAAGVKEGSLRQAKIRYDKKRREREC